jgi:hypothetical protein
VVKISAQQRNCRRRARATEEPRDYRGEHPTAVSHRRTECSTQWASPHCKVASLNYGHFTAHVMDAAAQNGHVHIIIWLHAHRREGCSSRAVVLAAMNGYLSVVQWLVSNYPVKVTADALLIAIGSGQTKVAQWLQSEVNIAWHGNFVVCATRHSCRELFAWTLSLFPDQCTPITMDNAALSGNRELFYELHNAGKSCTLIILQLAVSLPWCVGHLLIATRLLHQRHGRSRRQWPSRRCRVPS